MIEMFAALDPKVLGVTCYVATGNQYRCVPNFQVVFGTMIAMCWFHIFTSNLVFSPASQLGELFQLSKASVSSSRRWG